MDALANYLAMGGYAAYVWPAIGATALVLTVLLVASLRTLRRREAALAALAGEGRDDEARSGE